MNKFEKKAMAKRAYRALVKQAYDFPMVAYDNDDPGSGKQYFPYYTDNNGTRTRFNPAYDAADLPLVSPLHGVLTGLQDGPWAQQMRAPEEKDINVEYGNIVDGNWVRPHGGLISASTTPRNMYERFLNRSYNATRDMATAFDNTRRRLATSEPVQQLVSNLMANPNTALFTEAAKDGINYLGNLARRKQPTESQPVRPEITPDQFLRVYNASAPQYQHLYDQMRGLEGVGALRDAGSSMYTTTPTATKPVDNSPVPSSSSPIPAINRHQRSLRMQQLKPTPIK